MSLDVFLYSEPGTKQCECECGNVHKNESRVTLYTSNITQKLVDMALEARIYRQLWRPEECGITKAAQLIPVLKYGIEQMKESPGRFMVYDDPNGWGRYEDFVPWVQEYLDACIEYPEATVEVSR